MPLLATPVALSTSSHGKTVVAAQGLVPGTSVLPITGTRVDTPGKYMMQIGAQTHVLPDGQLWGWLNHSCTPNCHIDFRTWTLVTTRAIQRESRCGNSVYRSD